MQRYRVMSDNDGHDYFVPIDQEELFERWVASEESYGQEEYSGPEFEGNRIDGTFTFTDPRCE